MFKVWVKIITEKETSRCKVAITACLVVCLFVCLPVIALDCAKRAISLLQSKWALRRSVAILIIIGLLLVVLIAYLILARSTAKLLSKMSRLVAINKTYMQPSTLVCIMYLLLQFVRSASLFIECNFGLVQLQMLLSSVFPSAPKPNKKITLFLFSLSTLFFFFLSCFSFLFFPSSTYPPPKQLATPEFSPLRVLKQKL